MEEERNKKKKNKKKKNKQPNKATETIHVDGSASIDQSHFVETEHSRNDNIEGSITDRDELRSNGTDGRKMADDDRQYWLDREASYEEKIKELKASKDAQIRKESALEEKIKQLLEEKEELNQLNEYNNKLVQNEDVLREKLIQLVKEKEDLLQKVMLKEQIIQQSESEKATHLQKAAALARNVLQLEEERNTWLQKEASFQENINEMKQVKDLWTSKEASLEMKIVQLEGERDSSIHKRAILQETINQMERERDSLINELNSAKESIARTEDDNANLRQTVLELEQSRNTLLEETVRLSETISNLQLEAKNLEKTTYTNSNQSTADELANNLHGQGNAVTDDVSAQSPGDQNHEEEEESSANSKTEVASETLLQAPEIAHQPFEDIVITKDDQMNGELGTNEENAPEIITSSSEIVEEVDEIMQIPLEEEENLTREITETTQDKEEGDVPITDAPLIGAPFRFISFIARYVSGDDLVGKNTGKS